MINFAGKPLPTFVKVTSMDHSILPSIQHKSATILGRAGAYDFGVDLGMRKLVFGIQIIADNQNDIMYKATELAEWSFYEDLQVLVIDDEPDKQYMARISGETDISELFRVGQTSLEFVCPDAYKESITLRHMTASPLTIEEIIEIPNNGSAKVYPKMTMTFKQDAPAIALISNEDYLLFGQSEAGKAVVNASPLVLVDPLDTYTGFTTGLNPDGGINSGTFSSNGFSISTVGKDYGTGAGWHGPTAIKSLPTALQDFEAQMAIGHTSSTVNQMGRIELYLLDINNAFLGKMALTDNSGVGDHARVEGRAGNLSTGQYFVNDYGSKRGSWAKSQPAILRLGRKGNIWSFYIGKQGADGSHNTRLYKEWIDVKNQYSGKVAKIMIHIGVFGTAVPVNSMYFSDLKVWDRSIAVDNSTQVKMTFKKDDILTIDNSKAVVLLNGEPAYHLLNPTSRFFPLEKGMNGVILSPPIADVAIEYRERWL